MIVYVESNFLLEITLQQEQAASAEALLALAEAGRILVQWPAFCLAESLGALVRRRNTRQSVQTLILQQVSDLGRSDVHASLAGRLRDVSRRLVAVDAVELARLDGVVGRLLDLGRPTPLDADTHRDALRCRAEHGFSSQDAVVYASVLADLRRREPGEPKLFVTRDARGFGIQGVAAELAALGCTYMSSFDEVLGAARAS